MTSDFYLAPWKPYKGVLGAGALAAPIAYYFAWSALEINCAEKVYAAEIVLRWSLAWIIGWFLILFGDGAYGVLFPRPLRTYCVLLGILVITLPTVRAWAVYDADSISSRLLIQSLSETTKESLRSCLDPAFSFASVPEGKRYDFYRMLQAVRPVLSSEQRVRRVEFTSNSTATLWLSPPVADHGEWGAQLKKSRGRWEIDTLGIQ